MTPAREASNACNLRVCDAPQFRGGSYVATVSKLPATMHAARAACPLHHLLLRSKSTLSGVTISASDAQRFNPPGVRLDCRAFLLQYDCVARPRFAQHFDACAPNVRCASPRSSRRSSTRFRPTDAGRSRDPKRGVLTEFRAMHRRSTSTAAAAEQFQRQRKILQRYPKTCAEGARPKMEGCGSGYCSASIANAAHTRRRL